MRWYMDTEFNEDGRTIELISIALVADDGTEYYAHSADYDVAACNEWVKKHVLPKLAGVPPKPRAQIREEIYALVESKSSPEFWAYFADYDWVVFCQMFGRMIDLPPGWPMFCMDLKQLMKTRGIRRETLPNQTPDTEHSALEDAKWVRDAVHYIEHKAA